jgi:hypothetical protein
MSEFVLVPALLMGIAIGILEMIFVHADEAGMGWLIHALHALPVTMFFVFASMNITWVLGLFNMAILSVWYVDLGVRILIGIIAMVKIAGAAAIAGKVGERWYHTLIIGGIIIVAPYIWDLIGPMIMPTLPAFLQ